eukprot:m.99429 g.99429  ORF g.99429 m.99429 type:complete len:156 (+) comp37067_c0_seq16:2727-3194(+)
MGLKYSRFVCFRSETGDVLQGETIGLTVTNPTGSGNDSISLKSLSSSRSTKTFIYEGDVDTVRKWKEEAPLTGAVPYIVFHPPRSAVLSARFPVSVILLLFLDWGSHNVVNVWIRVNRLMMIPSCVRSQIFLITSTSCPLLILFIQSCSFSFTFS